MSTVLVVGGGANQVPLVRLAQEMGHRVVVTDMNQDPPCRAVANYFARVDTTDHIGTLAVARAHGVTAVVTDQTDAAVPTVAFVAEDLGLTGIGYEVALRFSNKFVSRTFLQQHVPWLLPSFAFFDSEVAAQQHMRTMAEVAVVKPINSQGSKGVAILNAATASHAISHAFVESRGRGVLIEEFIEGHEYSVEAYASDGKVHNLAVTRKYHYENNPCIDVRNTYLGDVDPTIQEALYRANTAVIEALGLPFGSTHAEYMVSGDRVTLMEIACRGGGGGISTHLIPYLTGFEPNRSLLSQLTNQPVVISYEDYRNRFAVLKFFEFRPGVVARVTKSIGDFPGLLSIELNIHPGQTLKPVMSSRDRPGFFIVVGDDRWHVLDRERRIQERVHIEYVA